MQQQQILTLTVVVHHMIHDAGVVYRWYTNHRLWLLSADMLDDAFENAIRQALQQFEKAERRKVLQDFGSYELFLS